MTWFIRHGPTIGLSNSRPKGQIEPLVRLFASSGLVNEAYRRLLASPLDGRLTMFHLTLRRLRCWSRLAPANQVSCSRQPAGAELVIATTARSIAGLMSWQQRRFRRRPGTGAKRAGIRWTMACSPALMGRHRSTSSTTPDISCRQR